MFNVTKLISLKSGVRINICLIQKPLVFLHEMVFIMNLPHLNASQNSSENYAPKVSEREAEPV